MFTTKEAQELIELKEQLEVVNIQQVNDNLFNCNFHSNPYDYGYTTADLNRIRNKVYDKHHTEQITEY